MSAQPVNVLDVLSYYADAFSEHDERAAQADELRLVLFAVAELIEREARMREALELLAEGGRRPGHLTKTRAAEIARVALSSCGVAS